MGDDGTYNLKLTAEQAKLLAKIVDGEHGAANNPPFATTHYGDYDAFDRIDLDDIQTELDAVVAQVRKDEAAPGYAYPHLRRRDEVTS